jgi:hypothetical protein
MGFNKLVVGVLGSLALLSVGYWGGKVTVEQKHSVSEDGAQSENISALTGAIHLLDSGDIAGTRTVLLAMASASLDPIIDSWKLTGNSDPEYEASRCSALARLRGLRMKYKFLQDSSTEAWRSDPEVIATEKRREAFLKSLDCKK